MNADHFFTFSFIAKLLANLAIGALIGTYCGTHGWSMRKFFLFLIPTALVSSALLTWWLQ